MEEIVSVTEYIDVAQIVLYLFWAFFFGLVFYLQRESRREGYPLVGEDGREENHGLWMDDPKKFELEHGDTVLYSNQPERRDLALEPKSGPLGDPFVPTGNPMKDGVGAASYAMRMDHPDVAHEGHVKIQPMSKASDYGVGEHDDDPRGMTVYGHDGKVAGVCSDLWIDVAEYVVRYLEVDLGEQGKVLLPYYLADIQGPRGILHFLLGIEVMKQGIFVNSITAAQFADCPRTKKPDEITLREEDMIMGYYGGGKLHSVPERSEPLI